MKPIAIFTHIAHEGPGYLAEFLAAQGLTWERIAVEAGAPIPASPDAYAGLVFMGGPMSINDDLPWIPNSLALIRTAVERKIPVLGHCLGAQLMARALGGAISRNPVKEIGWGQVNTLDNPQAHHWFGDIRQFETFHWHGETFSIPAGATRILESAHCANQAFTLGPHLGMQCHVEMTAAMVVEWCREGAAEIAAADSPAVQTAAAMQAQCAAKLPGLQDVAARLYGRWIAGLKP